MAHLASADSVPLLAEGEVMKGVALLSSAYLAPVEWYVRLCSYPTVRVERYDHYSKQTYRNRCVIASEGGRLALSIPTVDTGGGRTLMKDVRISGHGHWRSVHWNAFASAYRQSPYFDYYADEFRVFFEEDYELLLDFNRDLARWVCRQIDITPHVEYTDGFAAAPDDADDFRSAIHPKRGAGVELRSYWQVFSARHGFLPNLSIADMLFNMGPESLLLLREAAANNQVK